LLCSRADSVVTYTDTYTYSLIAAALHHTTLYCTIPHCTTLHFTILHLAMCRIYGDYHYASPPATIILLSLPLLHILLSSLASPFSLSPILYSSIPSYIPPSFSFSFSHPLHALIPSPSPGLSRLLVSYTMPSHAVMCYTLPSLLYCSM
jgi:hypothetical protein